VTLPDGRFVEVNAAGLAGIGYTREEMIGHTSAELNIWVDLDERDRYLQKLKTEGSVSGFEAQMRRKNGELFTVVCSASVIKIGGQTYALNALQDITVEKQAMERLRQSHKIELLGNLAGGIAHDFNNILSGMLSNVELARLDLPAAHGARQWIDRIAAAAGHAKNLVQQILTFSRMEEGERVPIRLQPVISAAMELMRTTMPSMMRIEEDIDENCPPVMADETQIHQVIMNLCTNAWHALPEHGGWIRVSLAPVGPNVLLSVRDNGCGMDSATLQRIYEPFFTTKDTGKGTGLGLAVTHGIVKSHGGVISVESAPGQGTTFEICLPAIDPAAPAAVLPKPAPTATTQGRNERVLFIDDEVAVGAPLTELLERLGYRVTYEADPKEALALFRTQPLTFDLVLTDLAMPGLTGRELAIEILRTRPDIPVILLTGLIEPKLREQLLQTGVRAVLTKPVTLGELSSSIAACLR
jgi:PAS domain S-box-containing protein